MQVYGIDLSKGKFDVSYLVENNEKKAIIPNNLKGICSFLKRVPNDSILVAEHAGSYGDLLVHLCDLESIRIVLVPGYSIKHSLGLQRGRVMTRMPAALESMVKDLWKNFVLSSPNQNL